MNKVAAVLLLFMDEEETFWVLCRVVSGGMDQSIWEGRISIDVNVFFHLNCFVLIAIG